MKWFFLGLALFFVSCGSDDLSNVRAYAEGKIVTENIAMGEVKISLISNGRVVSQGQPSSSGNFILSGPLFSDGFEVKMNHKIQSFSTSRAGCSISEDSLSVVVPEGISYISFDEIRLKP